MKTVVWTIVIAVLFLGGAASREALIDRLKPLAADALEPIWGRVSASIIATRHFLVQPATVRSGALLLLLYTSALFGVVVILGNAWILAVGPRLSQYRSDTFYRVRWRWCWKGRAATRHEGGETEDLHAECPACAGRMECGQKAKEPPPWWPKGLPHGNPFFFCKLCGRVELIEELCARDPCEFVVEMIRKDIDRRIENDEWRNAVRANWAEAEG